MYHSLCSTEVFVAGGGPAGLAAAIAARRAGFSVTLADTAIPPIDKTCGEGIMPDGLASLRALGVTLPSDQTVPFQGIRFSNESVGVDAQFTQGCGLGIRRKVLHQLLVDEAAQTGVIMHWGARITGLTQDGVLVNGRAIHCRWLVGADGQNSRIRYWAGLDSVRPQTVRRFGFRCHYTVKPWSDFVEVYWTSRGQIYVTPVGPDQVCVALITRRKGTRLEDAFHVFREIRERLGSASPTSRQQGAITVTQSLPRVFRGSRVLVGEASGSVDAITGDGLSMAFQQAQALASSLKANDLAIYEKAHRRISRMPKMMARLMLLMDRSPWLCRRALRALSAEPALFSRMLAVHTGALPPTAFGLQGTLALGWHLITTG